ncbi:MAG: TIGR03086 family metal-binding protein [Actinomycetota bacterium]
MSTDDELRTALAAAMRGFAEVVAGLGSDDLATPSMCPGWSVRDVVDHIIAGDRFAALALDGRSLGDAADAVLGVDHVGDDPVGNLAEAAAAARAGFARPLDVTVDHPIGPLPARRFIGFRVLDQLGHTWDVAHALGDDIDLDAAAIDIALAVCDLEREMLDASAHFTMAVDAATDADPQLRFLRSIGRS